MSFIDELGRLWDKKFSVSPLVRLGVQAASVLLAYMLSDIGIHEFQLPGGLLLEFSGLMTLLLTIGWFLLFINAINWFDGIYGLASGVSSM